MRLLILQDHLRRGGTERQSLFAAQTLQNAGHQTALIIFRPGGKLEADVRSAHFPIKHLQPFNSGIDEWAPGLIASIRSFAPDLILTMGKVANLKTRTLRKKLPTIPVINTLRTGKTLSRKLQSIYREASHIVVNSKDASNRLQSLGINKSRISILYNACLAMPEMPPDEAPSKPFHLVSLAMLRPEKNHSALLDVAATLPQDLPWKLTFAGAGSCLKALKEKTSSLGLSNRVNFPGALSDITPLLTSAHLCLSTSLCESLPNALVEAQAHGVPVVAYDANGVGETFIPGESGLLIPPGETKAMAFAIESLLRDHARRQAFRKQAFDHAHKTFAPVQQAQHFLDIVSNIKE